MKKKKYITPKAGQEMMLLESLMTVSKVRGTANDIGLGDDSDPGAAGGGAAARSSLWDDSE